MKATALSPAEKRQLAKLETSIQANLQLGQQHLRKAAAELAQVKALCLYRADGTFEAYCERRWGICRSRGYQLVQLDAVSTIVGSDQVREAHARVLAPHDAEEQRAAWAAATAGGATPTAAKLEELLQADADAQIDAVRDEEDAALRDQPARQPRKTRSPREVIDAIGRHLKAIGKLVRHLPDIAEQAEYEIEQLRKTVEGTTES